MDYSKIYLDLCKRGKSKRNLTYAEKHHIIPKSLGGSDASHNIATLSYREHFIAHRLLCRMFPEDASMKFALWCMIRKHPSGQRTVSSRMFETAKQALREALKSLDCHPNPGKSANSRAAARKRMLTKNPMKINPERNHTAYPVRIDFIDGNFKEFSYLKKASQDLGVPYSTLQYIMRYKIPSKKHGIVSLSKL